MSRILITGSAQGLGRNAATALLDDGHQVVVHARSHHRAADLSDLAARGAAVVVGNLASLEQTRSLADQVNQLGRMDAVIHNAGVYGDTGRHPSLEGHPRVLTVNTLAPYLLTGLIQRPDRLIYLTSDMHTSGDDSLHDLDLEHPPLERHPGLLRQQAVRHRPRPRRRPPLARRDQPRRRPRLGTHPDGRPHRQRRPRTRPPHPDLARHHRRPRSPRGPVRSGNTADQPRSRPPPRTPPSRTDSSTSWPTSPATSSSRRLLRVRDPHAGHAQPSRGPHVTRICDGLTQTRHWPRAPDLFGLVGCFDNEGRLIWSLRDHRQTRSSLAID